MTNTVKQAFELGHGIKVVLERPYGTQDAIDEFKRDIEAKGGKVSQVHDELAVTGNIAHADVFKASQKLTENLKKATSPLDEALRRYGKAVGLDPAFVDKTVDAPKSPTGRFATGGPINADYSALEARVLAELVSPFPFGFPSFAFIARGSDVLRQSQAAPKPAPAPVKKPKLVAKTAPDALSTWEFTSTYLKRMHGGEVNLVGQHYRTKADQEVLGWKREGNMALLVAEPDNPVDLNAVMVLVWNDQTKHWHHAGYVKAEQAAALRGKWTGDFKNVMVARITSIPRNPDGHRGGRNIKLTLTGECRTYPGYVL